MKNMLRDVWSRDRRGFLTILFLNIAVSLTGGISIVMLVPMLGLLNVSEGATSALRVFTEKLQMLSYERQVIILIGCYFLLVVFKALLSRFLSIRESHFLEDYSYNLREQLYHAVSGAHWEQLAASRQTDTINLFTSQCSQVSYGVGDHSSADVGGVYHCVALHCGVAQPSGVGFRHFVRLRLRDGFPQAAQGLQELRR